MAKTITLFSKPLTYSHIRRSTIMHALKAFPWLYEIVKIIIIRRKQPLIHIKDVCRYLGKCSHGDITSFGLLLSLLEHYGFVTRANSSKKHKVYWLGYELIELAIKGCELKCRSCGLKDSSNCPFQFLKQLLKEVEGNDSHS